MNILRPEHYHNDSTMEPFEIIKKDTESWRGFCYGNIIKYVQRYKDKNGVEDLKKARVYLDELIKSFEDDNNMVNVYNPEPNKDVYNVISNFNEDNKIKWGDVPGCDREIKPAFETPPSTYGFKPTSIYSIVNDHDKGQKLDYIAYHYGVHEDLIKLVLLYWTDCVRYFENDYDNFIISVNDLINSGQIIEDKEHNGSVK